MNEQYDLHVDMYWGRVIDQATPSYEEMKNISYALKKFVAENPDYDIKTIINCMSYDEIIDLVGYERDEQSQNAMDLWKRTFGT